MIEISITNEQKVKVTLTPVTESGKPAVLDGIPVWSIVNGNSTILASEDGLSCDLISSDDAGDTVVMVTADVNLGETVENVSDTITLHVLMAQAANLGLTIGTPEKK